MLVEDDEQFTYLIQRYAETSGCAFVATNQGQEALRCAHDERPDVILLDLALATAENWHLLDALRHDTLTRAIPVIICSGSPALADAWAHGADLCLAKPLLYSEFLSALADMRVLAAASGQR